MTIRILLNLPQSPGNGISETLNLKISLSAPPPNRKGFPTALHIHTRISEHKGVSPLTEKKRSVSTMPGILAHILTTKRQISPSDFKILSTATSEADLLIRERLFISQLNPILNANNRSTPLDLF